MSDVMASLDLVSWFVKIWELKQQHQRVAEAPTSLESYNTTLCQPTKPLLRSFLQHYTPTKKSDNSSLFVWWCPALWVWWPGQCQCCDHGTPEADHVTSPWCYPHCDAAAAAVVASQVSFLVCCQVNNFSENSEEKTMSAASVLSDFLASNCSENHLILMWVIIALLHY